MYKRQRSLVSLNNLIRIFINKLRIAFIDGSNIVASAIYDSARLIFSFDIISDDSNSS